MKNEVKQSDLLTENLKLRQENQELSFTVKILAILLLIDMVVKGFEGLMH